jgi:integrase
VRGHIRKRSRGSYTVVIYLGRDPETGKRRYLWRSIKGTKRDAEALLTRLLAKHDTGTDLLPSKLTVEQFSEEWLKTLKKKVKPRTHARYCELLRIHIVPHIGAVELKKLKPLHIERLLLRCRQKGLSERTLLHVFRVLHTALVQAVQWQLVERNVAQAVQPPKPEKNEMDAVTPEDADRILAAAADTEIEVPVTIALGTGMRLGEVLGLRWSDIDFKSESLRVRQTLNVDRTFGTPKSYRSRRSIPLPKFLLKVLKTQRARLSELRLMAGSAWQDHDLVASRADGSPMDPRRVSRLFTALAKESGYDFTFHGLRHAYASLMLASGIDLKVTSDLLGHSTIGITADLYTHVTERLHKEAAERLDALLGHSPPQERPQPGR